MVQVAVDPLTGLSASFSRDNLTGGKIPADTDTPNILQVTGQGEVSIPTTLAQVQLGVQIQKTTAAEVQEELAQLSTAVVDVLQNLKAQELQTIDIQLNPVYSYPDNIQTLIGFEGSNIIQFQLPTDQTGAAIDAAIQAGANIVQSINFTATETALQQAQQDALTEAVQDAQAQANVVLNSLELVPGEIINIDINAADILNPSPLLLGSTAVAFSDKTPILGGPQTVQANVSLDIVYSPDPAGTLDTATVF